MAPHHSVGSSAVLVFLKSLATPIVLYTPNTQETFQELKALMKQAKPTSPKLVEKETLGPLKQVFFWDTEIVGAALQTDGSGNKAVASLPVSASLNPLKPKGNITQQTLH
jgi:hypothetical protein